MLTPPAAAPRLPPPDEPRLPVSRLAHLFPLGRLGAPVHADTLADYVRRGLRGIYLEGGHSGNAGWWSTAAAVDRFLAALTARAMGRDVPPPVPTDLERRAAKATADFDKLRASWRKPKKAQPAAGG